MRSPLHIYFTYDKPSSVESVLAVVSYGLTPPSPLPIASTHVPLALLSSSASVPVSAADQSEVGYEVFGLDTHSTPITRGVHGAIHYAHNGDWLFGVIETEEKNYATLCDATDVTYQNLIEFQKQFNEFKLVKVWNYLGAITAINNGIQRYQGFCTGRFKACGDSWATLPAACALGTHNTKGRLCVFWIASRHTVATLENPRQTSAFHYPPHYSPQAPLFSRAVRVAHHPFISGTASIVGHQSQHPGQLPAQVLEIFDNLQALLHCTLRELISGYFYKVYLKHPSDLALLHATLEHLGLNVLNYVVLHSDVCRDDLLVEFEPILRNPP